MTVFTHVVITAPSREAIECYQEQLRGLQLECDVICCADPDGCRIGSGGGTLNALDNLDQLIGREKLLQSRVLVVHSGGDSRRAPLHSVCGKAWATINSTPIKTPMELLVEEISAFCKLIPAGSVVVASSDVLLDIDVVMKGEGGGEGAMVIPQDVVSIVVVPERPEVAKNHGVLVPQKNKGNNTITSISGVAQSYLQKPSIALMEEAGAIDVQSGNAWIDTGLVIASGSAFKAMLALLDDDTISHCTERVICGTSDSKKNKDDNKGSSCGTSDSKKNNKNKDDNKGSSTTTTTTTSNDTSASASRSKPLPLRLELYSDMLLALALTDGPCTQQQYAARLGLEGSSGAGGVGIINNNAEKGRVLSDALVRLWEGLHRVSLHVLLVPNGTFCHLGTSAELLEMLCAPLDAEVAKINTNTNTYTKKNTNTNTNTNTSAGRREGEGEGEGGGRSKARVFGDKYELAAQVGSYTSSLHASSVSVLANSYCTSTSLPIPIPTGLPKTSLSDKISDDNQIDQIDHVHVPPRRLVEHSVLTCGALKQEIEIGTDIDIEIEIDIAQESIRSHIGPLLGRYLHVSICMY